MTTGTLPKRADAVRNRERVIAAAAEVFAERGIEASVPEVAARAGVGKATVYRSFPTKEHLVAAVVNDRIDEYERRARELLADKDAWDALHTLLSEKASEHCGDRSLASALHAGIAADLLAEARRRMWGAIGELMARAQAEGRMRAGVGSQDVRMLFAGVSQMLRAEGNRDPAAWRHYAELVANAVRA